MGPINIWRNTAGDALAERTSFNMSAVDEDPPGRHVFAGAADLSGDGSADILAYSGSEESMTGYLSWYDYPTFERHVMYEGDFHAERPTAVDIDADGDLDVFVGNGERTTAYEYENPRAGEGLWTEQYVGKTDGDPDVVTNGRWFETPADARGGHFVEHEIDEKWHNQDVDWRKNSTMTKVADVEGDGRLDVVFTHSELPGYPVSWYEADDPKGTWTEHVIDPDFGWAETLDLGDVDRGGDLDVLTGRFERANERLYDYWLSELPDAVRIY